MSASLLDRDAVGGAVARTGFEYQDAFVLQHLPMWLSESAFSHVVSESKGDIEVCYFCPGFGIGRRTYEAKDYALTEPQFWSELADFKAMFEASPKEFVAFTLLCPDFKRPVEPLINKLERFRGVGSSYPSQSPILAVTRDEIVDWVVTQGQPVDLANFIIDKVDFSKYHAGSADTSFGGMIEKYLPSIDMSSKRISAWRDVSKALVAKTAFGPLHRIDIEKSLATALDAESGTWLKTPTEIRLESGQAGIEHLALEVGPFIGADRANRTLPDWETLRASAEQLGEFIAATRDRGAVSLDGKQRMSLACLMGSVFSATRGFTLDICHNGQIYRTDDHSKDTEPFFVLSQHKTDALMNSGVACIGFPTPIGEDFSVSTAGELLEKLPRISLGSDAAIGSMSTLNRAVAEVKAELVRFRSENKLEKLHLFLKAPSFFAMALGHRLNGVGKVILYDWIDGAYVKTAELV